MNKKISPYFTTFLFIFFTQIIYANAQVQQSNLSSNNYESKVEKYHFANIYQQQIKQLESNPLLKRYKESRRKFTSDPHRPIFHFVSPEGNLNDPNGLCFWQDKWHLFYQAYPPEDPRQHWGHAVSDDLIHWQDLPLAIYPNPEQKCFSGSTLVEDDRVIAMYHGTKAGTMIAVSTDPLLLNWKKIGPNNGIVIPYPKPGEPKPPYNIFDPCIWKHGDTYYALTAGTQRTGPDRKPVRAHFLHRSKNLIDWEYMHPFVEDDHYSRVGDDGACPYFWPIGDNRHILLHFSHMRGGKYLIGKYDTERQKFKVTNGGYFNHGPVAPGGVHAPSAYPDGKGNIITIFNINPAKKAKGWNQIMTLPIRLSLADNDSLTMKPAGNYQSLRHKHVRVDSLTLPSNQEVVLDSLQGKAMELVVEIDPKSASTVELNLFRSPDQKEFTRIIFYKNRGMRDRTIPGKPKLSAITIDSSRSSILEDVQARVPETAEFFLDQKEPLKLHIFIDKSVVEVFVNERQYLAQRVYPGLKSSNGFSIRATGGDAKVNHLEAWQMNSIYD